MKRAEFGSGALSEGTAVVYWHLVVGVLFLLITAPGTIPALFLERHISNAPLYALFLTPVAPALCAALFALARRPEAEAMTPAQFFFRGYRINFVDSLKVWVPAVLLLTMLTVNLSNVAATGFGAWYPVVGLLLALVLIVWLLVALTIVSLFSFRSRDVIRLSLGYLLGLPLVSLGVAGVVVLGALIALVTFDAVVVLAAPLLVALLLRVTAPMREAIRRKFTADSAPLTPSILNRTDHGE